MLKFRTMRNAALSTVLGTGLVLAANTHVGSEAYGLAGLQPGTTTLEAMQHLSDSLATQDQRLDAQLSLLTAQAKMISGLRREIDAFRAQYGHEDKGIGDLRFVSLPVLPASFVVKPNALTRLTLPGAFVSAPRLAALPLRHDALVERSDVMAAVFAHPANMQALAVDPAAPAIHMAALPESAPTIQPVGVPAPAVTPLQKTASLETAPARPSSLPAAKAQGGRMNDGELSDIRGGYIDAAGLRFDFGATLNTYVDGTLALSSTLTLTAQGLTTTQTANPDAQPLNTAANYGINLGNQPGQGVVIPGLGGGATAVIQDLSQTTVRNTVVNTATQRNITQDTTLNFVIPNLPQLQQQAVSQQVQSGLQTAVSAALRAAAH
jgi:hypothetical protein